MKSILPGKREKQRRNREEILNCELRNSEIELGALDNQ